MWQTAHFATFYLEQAAFEHGGPSLSDRIVKRGQQLPAIHQMLQWVQEWMQREVRTAGASLAGAERCASETGSGEL